MEYTLTVPSEVVRQEHHKAHGYGVTVDAALKVTRHRFCGFIEDFSSCEAQL